MVFTGFIELSRLGAWTFLPHWSSVVPHLAPLRTLHFALCPLKKGHAHSGGRAPRSRPRPQRPRRGGSFAVANFATPPQARTHRSAPQHPRADTELRLGVRPRDFCYGSATPTLPPPVARPLRPCRPHRRSPRGSSMAARHLYRVPSRQRV